MPFSKLFTKQKTGRAGETRTLDLLHPMQARYQTAPQPEQEGQGIYGTWTTSLPLLPSGSRGVHGRTIA